MTGRRTVRSRADVSGWLTAIIALLKALPKILDGLEAFNRAREEHAARKEKEEKDARNKAAIDAALKEDKTNVTDDRQK